ncbi:MAG: nucleotidyltransferase family protein [Polaribacter sp.]
MNIIKKNSNKLNKLCKKYKVLKLYVFGSITKGNFTDKSDIDFLVSFKKMDLYNYADNYFDFVFSLEDLFKRNIDLLEEKALKNPYLIKSIDNSKELVYG